MLKITVIGAGKTGRGFIGRLLTEAGAQFGFVDKNAELVQHLKSKGSFGVSFFGNSRAPMTVKCADARTWDDADVKDTDLFFVSVCGPNLKDVGAELKKRLSADKKYYIITCENADSPAAVLSEAIGMDNVYVSQSTVFCTTIEDEGIDISSENYPYLQYDSGLLREFDTGVSTLRPIKNFGDLLTRKLFTYNAASCIIAYMGWLYGYSDYGEAANDPRILELLDRNYAVTNRVLCAEFGYTEEDQAEFAALSKRKFCDRTIKDTIARNAREPQRKLGPRERVTGPMLVIDKYGEDTSVLMMTAAAMLLYDAPGEDKWRAIRAEKTPGQILCEICGLEEGSRLYEGILGYRDEFERIAAGLKR